MRRQFNQGIGRDSDLAASFQPSEPVPPPPRPQYILTLRDLDFMTPEQLYVDMLSRGLPYGDNFSKQQHILQILRYDTDHRPSITQPVYPRIPKALPPVAVAASTAAERRAILQSRLALSAK